MKPNHQNQNPHKWTPGIYGLECSWCQCVSKDHINGDEATCDQVASYSAKVSIFPNPDFESLSQKIPAIKILRQHLVPDHSLKTSKGFMDRCFRGETVDVRVMFPQELRIQLEALGVGVLVATPEPIPEPPPEPPPEPELSESAQKILEALQKKPDLWEELKNYFLWESATDHG